MGGRNMCLTFLFILLKGIGSAHGTWCAERNGQREGNVRGKKGTIKGNERSSIKEGKEKNKFWKKTLSVGRRQERAVMEKTGAIKIAKGAGKESEEEERLSSLPGSNRAKAGTHRPKQTKEWLLAWSPVVLDGKQSWLRESERSTNNKEIYERNHFFLWPNLTFYWKINDAFFLLP